MKECLNLIRSYSWLNKLEKDFKMNNPFIKQANSCNLNQWLEAQVGLLQEEGLRKN